MFVRALIILTLYIGVSIPAAVDAGSSELASPRLKEKAATLAPFSFIKLCGAHPEQCKNKSGASEIKLDGRNTRRLEAINATVNRTIQPQKDAPGRDRWSLDVAGGDCEEYALAKRRELIKIGLPPRAIRLAVGKTGSGEAHAVVVVKTDKGDIALDNRNDAPQPVNRLGLAWEKIESSDNPKLWRSL
ncbi:Predicted transglutaminase-like cysteine proteinase [Rhizobium sp. NFR07]|uniref:transglutaminase-like cysteine peptidase n=1 Tax=Rhizobium sp. NFR07 TaxID=1566262 RepID=UPI0008E01DCB|nr:transglutaminase-like cysteine peptidase [Rhizobium sp. NFR07]SFB63045.1 Predicted transglutaminase-like cysteine proteinase [Rhizobium sp. NFR07]